MQQINYCEGRVWSRRKTDHAGMGHRYSGSMPEGKGPIFLQAMGTSSEDAKRAGRTLEGSTWDEMPTRMNLVKA